MKYYCDDCGKRIFKKDKEVYKCVSCGKILCGQHSFINVDENNIRITKYLCSIPMCGKCFKKR